MQSTQTVAIPKTEYQGLIQRQIKIEKELSAVKEMIRSEMNEARIPPEILSRWERISRDLDNGKGRTFSSPRQMRAWLKDL